MVKFRADRSGGIRYSTGASLIALSILLSACGGGSGGGVISTPAPTPTPAPAPTPTPTPTPTPAPTPAPSNFDTEEYRLSDGAVTHGAMTAWAAGATGEGVKIAFVDTGIDSDSPEFAGRIDAASRDFAGNASFDGVDDHGTRVALVAAAARDGLGVMGIAWEAGILALRTDSAGSCGSTDDCSFDDANIAAAIDYAVDNGARVINLSLGGGGAATVLRQAVTRAAQAGVVVVVAAGNDGSSTDPSADASQPDVLAQDLANAGGNLVIIAGSINAAGDYSSFSNKAGDFASSFISAVGEDVCCVYENGVLKVDSEPDGDYVYTFSGSSFSVPQVSGAVALLAQAFPNLTGAEIVEILLSTAQDAGAAGADGTFGSGILDIAAAFSPQGTTSLAGSGTSLALTDQIGTGSPAMGDAIVTSGLSAIVTDKYLRAYSVDLATGLRGTGPNLKLQPALAGRTRNVSLNTEKASIAVSIDARKGAEATPWIGQLRISSDDAEGARVLAARAAFAISPDTKLGFAFAEGADGLAMQLQGYGQAAFLVAEDAAGADGDTQRPDASAAIRKQIGPYGLTISAQSGEMVAPARQWQNLTNLDYRHDRYSAFGIALDRRWGGLTATLGLTYQDEGETLFGARFHDALGLSGSRTIFLDNRLAWDMDGNIRLGLSLRNGWTSASGSGPLGAGAGLYSNAWSFDLERRGGVFGTDDSIGIRIAQPLRVESGALNFLLPVSYDYATESAAYAARSLNLAPQGREVMTELAWHGALWGGQATASTFYRRQPGHYAELPDDIGMALRWSANF